MSIDRAKATGEPADPLADAYETQQARWRARCGVILSYLLPWGVRPKGWLYAWKRCHNGPLGETETKTTIGPFGDPVTYTVHPRGQTAGQDEHDRWQALAARAVDELAMQTGIDAAKWPALLPSTSETPARNCSDP